MGIYIWHGHQIVVAWGKHGIQTLKNSVDLLQSIDWNTDICFSCDASLGGCSQGLDFPYDLSEGHSMLIVSGEIVDDPCTSYGYINIVNKNGVKQWDYTERNFESIYIKSLAIGSSDFIVAGVKRTGSDR